MQVNGDLNCDGNINMLGTTSFKIPATAKLYLDGGGDTYLVETSGNTVSLYTNGAVAWTTNTTSLTLGSGLDLTLLTTKKLNFNVGGTAYAFESATNVIDIYANSGKLFTIDGANSFVKVNTGIDFAIAATKKLYLDAGANTYIQESAADTVGIYTNATLGLQVSTTLVSIGSARDLAVTATKKLYLDGGGDTYLAETSANLIDIYAGGAIRLRINPNNVAQGFIFGNTTSSSGATAQGAINVDMPGVGTSDTLFNIWNDTRINTYFYINDGTPTDGDILMYTEIQANNSAAATENAFTSFFVCEDTDSASYDSAYIGTLQVAGSDRSITINNNADTYIKTDFSVLPMSGNTYDLGTSSLDWNNIYSVNALNVTSDKRLKESITDVPLGLDFINDLSPVFFKWKDANKEIIKLKKITDKDGNSKELKKISLQKKENSEKRFHAGFIAQDVEKILKKHKVDFGVLCHDKEADKYTMRSEELLPILTKAIQELSSKIDALEKKAKK